MVFTWTQLNVVFWAISVQRKSSLSDRQANTIKQEIKESSALNASGCCIISQFSSEYLSLLELHLFSRVPVSCSLWLKFWYVILHFYSVSLLINVVSHSCSLSLTQLAAHQAYCTFLHYLAGTWFTLHQLNSCRLFRSYLRMLIFSALSKNYLLYLNPLILSRQL